MKAGLNPLFVDLLSRKEGFTLRDLASVGTFHILKGLHLNWLFSPSPGWQASKERPSYGVYGKLAVFKKVAVPGDRKDIVYVGKGTRLGEYEGDPVCGTFARRRAHERSLAKAIRIAGGGNEKGDDDEEGYEDGDEDNESAGEGKPIANEASQVFNVAVAATPDDFDIAFVTLFDYKGLSNTVASIQDMRVTCAVAEAILAEMLDAYETSPSEKWNGACTHSAMTENVPLASG